MQCDVLNSRLWQLVAAKAEQNGAIADNCTYISFSGNLLAIAGLLKPCFYAKQGALPSQLTLQLAIVVDNNCQLNVACGKLDSALGALQYSSIDFA
jgi:hypothetical protein